MNGTPRPWAEQTADKLRQERDLLGERLRGLVDYIDGYEVGSEMPAPDVSPDREALESIYGERRAPRSQQAVETDGTRSAIEDPTDPGRDL